MNEGSSLLECLSDDAVWRLEDVCSRFEQSWQAGQRPRLEEFLAGADGAERLALLRELLWLDVDYRQRAGEGPSREDYQTRFPEATALLEEVFAPCAGPYVPQPMPETVDGSVGAGPGLLPATTDDRPASANGEAPADGEPGDGTASRYRMLRFHKAGGLGEVFVAEDTELHREVALKEIKPQYADREESRTRFILEGEITGRLEHPGVVPVYGLGTYPDGRPYYAMRFIRGETLAAAVQRFHGQTPVRFDALEFRQLLGRFVAVCQAVAYAHSRGVLHRDIKPGNIMLGKFGETLVVDWGLAKVVGRPGGGAVGSGEEGALRPCGGDGIQTQGAVGTPAFMSPEQAAGKAEELGPATDVYSLGATLYAVLTNRAPFQGPVGEVVQQVERGAWVPARQVNGAVPAALDAICRKAMALRPAERYASALDLAGDVEDWLGDEPVSAYREPRGARVRRWMRKHPRGVTGAVVLLLTAVVGLTVGAVLLQREKQEKQENFEMADKAVSECLIGVDSDFQMNEPGMQPLQQQLLFSGLDYYTQFLARYPEDPRAQQKMAQAKRQLGELYGQVGRSDEARSSLLQSVESYEVLVRRAPADRELRFGLAHARRALAHLQVQSGEPGEGKNEVDRALELLEKLTAEEPLNERFLNLLGRCYDLRATIEGYRGDAEASLADSKRAIRGFEEAVKAFGINGGGSDGVNWGRFPHLPSKQGDDPQRGGWNDDLRGDGGAVAAGSGGQANFILLARAYTNHGTLLARAGRQTEAVPVLQKATVGYRWWLHPNLRAGQLRHGLGLALLHTGRVEAELGRPSRAEATLREAYEQMRQLVRDDPFVPEYAATRLLAAGYLGEDLYRSGRTATAAELLREAGEQGEKILGGPGRSRGLRAEHARLLQVLSCLERESGDIDRGLRTCQRAGEKLEQALKDAPGDRSLWSDWLRNREALAQCRFLKGDITRVNWIDEQKTILAKRRDLAGKDPPAPRFQGEVAGSAAILAGLLLEAGRTDEALVCADEALRDHERLVLTEQECAKKRAAGDKPPAAEEPDSRLRPPGLQRTLIPDIFLVRPPIEPEDLELRRQWAMLLARKGAALAQVGRGAEAVEAVRQAIAMTEGLLRGEYELRIPPASPASVWSFLAEELYRQEPCYLYDLACHLALASTLPADASSPDPARRAVQALRDYVTSGFDNPHKLRTDPALKPLRERADFQKLVADLEAKAQGRTAPI